MIMDGINEKLQSEHEDYIQMKTRVDVIVALMRSDDYMNRERLLTILGTKEATELLTEIRKKNQEQEKRENAKYSGAIEHAQV